MERKNKAKFIGSMALIVLALIVPLITQNPSYLHTLITAYMFSMLTLGFVLVWVTGRLPLGQAGFFAIGGYSSALMVMQLGLSFWVALLLAGIVAGFFGLMIGWVVVRRGGITFIMLTWAFAEVIRLVISNERTFLGGRFGIANVPDPKSISIFGLATIDFISRIPYYYLILLLLLVMVFFLWRLYNSRFGRIFRSLSQSDRLSQSVGVDIANYRLWAFTIAAFFGGLAGSFYAHYFNYLNPVAFNLLTSINIQVYAVVGGVFNFISGPLIGTIFLVVISQFLHGLIIWERIIYGAVLIFIALFLSGGLASVPHLFPGTGMKLYQKFRTK